MIRRKTYDKLPLQGNVYPMPTMAYIEDDYMRFTVLASQPSGVACLKPGKFVGYMLTGYCIQLRIRNP
jgi:alpha-mannosidase II